MHRMQEAIKKYEYKVALLQIANKNGNLFQLIHSDMNNLGKFYDEFACLKKKEFITEQYGKLCLTDKGLMELERLNRLLKRKGIYKYVSPQDYKTIDKIGINEVYIPIKKK